jgi:four helix bundle protein
MKNFAYCVEELEVFQKAYQASLRIHKLTLTFPKIEQYALADQLRRATKSICANLSEGFAKQKDSKKEFARYVSLSLGSSDESRIWLQYASDLGYIEEPLAIEKFLRCYEGFHPL